MMHKPPTISASQGRAPTNCPVCCAADPTNDDTDAVASVGHAESERGSGAFLESFACPAGHDLLNLTVAQERAVLESAQSWIYEARAAMQDAADDARFDSYREEGF